MRLCYVMVTLTYFFLVLKKEHANKLCDSSEYGGITDVLKGPMILARMSQMHVAMIDNSKSSKNINELT